MAAKPQTDQDGKSKTASAVDALAYPEQHEVESDSEVRAPTHEQIADRARQLWEERGRPEGTHEQDWFEAESELRDQMSPRSDLRRGRKEGGSVQR